jgi:hypothetical protein
MAWPNFLFGLALVGLQLYIYFYGYLRGSVPAPLALGAVSWLVAGTFGHDGKKCMCAYIKLCGRPWFY